MDQPKDRPKYAGPQAAFGSSQRATFWKNTLAEIPVFGIDGWFAASETFQKDSITYILGQEGTANPR